MHDWMTFSKDKFVLNLDISIQDCCLLVYVCVKDDCINLRFDCLFLSQQQLSVREKSMKDP